MNLGYRLSKESFLMLLAFVVFFCVTCYKLTYAPLWFDETIEYWYSKTFIGGIPFGSPPNMYQRIVSTFQPPLYNFLMYFWLKVSSSEFWFRFFGVLMGFAGNVAIYKSVQRIGNSYIAVLAVLFTSFIGQMVYYWQEAAEYCLMLGTLCWTVYFFIAFIKKQTLNNIIGLTISSILAVYSQYGAAFLVSSVLMTAYIYALIKREKSVILEISITYIVAFITTALPLVFLFLLKQIEYQQNTIGEAQGALFEVNIFYDIIKNFAVVVCVNLFPETSAAAIAFTFIFISCGIVVLVFSKKAYARCLVIVNITTYIFYYISVKAGLYSYGNFGGRYCLFFIPLWVVSVFSFGIEITELLQQKFVKIKKIRQIAMSIAIVTIVCYMIFSWNKSLKNNWIKEDMRGAVRKWIECDANTSQTIVFYGGCPAFSYYIRHSDVYNSDIEDKVTYMPWHEGKTLQFYTDYVDSIYGTEWPEEVYFIASHTNGDIYTIAEAFTTRGYSEEILFEHDGGILVRFR